MTKFHQLFQVIASSLASVLDSCTSPPLLLFPGDLALLLLHCSVDQEHDCEKRSFQALCSSPIFCHWYCPLCCRWSLSSHHHSLKTTSDSLYQGVGTFVVAPLANYWFEAYGWRGALRCLAGLCLACSLCGLAMLPAKQQSQPDVSPQHHQTSRSSSRRKGCIAVVLGDQMASSPLLSMFFLVAIADCLAFIGLYIPYTYLPSAGYFFSSLSLSPPSSSPSLSPSLSSSSTTLTPTFHPQPKQPFLQHPHHSEPRSSP